MRIHLGGHLSWYDLQKRSWLELAQPQPIALLDLARRLGVPAAEIAVVTVNRRAVELATAGAVDADTVEFFSAIGGGCTNLRHSSRPQSVPPIVERSRSCYARDLTRMAACARIAW